MNDKRIKAGVTKTSEVIGAINDIKSSIKLIKNMIEQIYKATEAESKGSQTIMEIINSFADESANNVKSIDALGRTRNHLSMEVQKMRNLILAFKVQGVEKEVIKDIKNYSKEEKDKMLMEKRIKNQQMLEERNEKKKKKDDIKVNKISSSKELLDYKPKINLMKKQKSNKLQKDKKEEIIHIPQDTPIEKFEKNIFNKIKKQEEKDFILTLYKKDIYSKVYSLKSNLDEKDKTRLENILKDIKYR